ncbi:2-amino-4-hydroxy-6-hydroxymethyldihydropteridine diphosphokinase [Anaeromyxobacter oryzae]|uniref:2-amino-4-hydroxy-6-hydroxymethyldihydropteridine pyrophosphokinase n=1 Tax=Anaeromyxobacter oryzae TaxID=2918170 RepID=A0ABM7WWR5_9BACT|nr:2-amino-4-hydroxy-6-hydroxymethyldihydropteridine diphosphokinase [Anaeromyxobacter oryzae]BDG03941.1 2-amino-4-hydroxy-6-hydroxymethyldihydropteridine diphosphokinase [Anaeromyxobacter oryzae]
MLAYVGVGTNLGDRWGNLTLAARTLKAEPRVALVRASRVYDTAPVGPPQPRYLNAVLEVETALPAQAFFAVLQMAENAAGRKRTGVKWAARTLDLDLLLFGDEVIRRPPALIVPHPEIPNRRFVLAPLAELCPERVVPGTGQTVAQLLSRAPPGDVACAGLYTI